MTLSRRPLIAGTKGNADNGARILSYVHNPTDVLLRLITQQIFNNLFAKCNRPRIVVESIET